MKIEIELNEQHIEEQVIQEIADRISNQYGAESLITKVKKLVDLTVQDRLEGVISNAVAQALSTPIQRYDTFGNKVESPMSLEEIVRAGADRYLKELTKHDGTVSTSNYDTRKPRIMWALEQHAIKGLDAEIKEHAKAIKADLTKKATLAAAQLLTQIKL